jgi:hypothetical protein
MLMIKEIALTQPAVRSQTTAAGASHAVASRNKPFIPVKTRSQGHDVTWLEMLQFALRLSTPFR